MSLAGLHLQITQQINIEPTPERLEQELETLKHYIARYKYVMTWQALAKKLEESDYRNRSTH